MRAIAMFYVPNSNKAIGGTRRDESVSFIKFQTDYGKIMGFPTFAFAFTCDIPDVHLHAGSGWYDFVGVVAYRNGKDDFFSWFLQVKGRWWMKNKSFVFLVIPSLNPLLSWMFERRQNWSFQHLRKRCDLHQEKVESDLQCRFYQTAFPLWKDFSTLKSLKSSLLSTYFEWKSLLLTPTQPNQNCGLRNFHRKSNLNWIRPKVMCFKIFQVWCISMPFIVIETVIKHLVQFQSCIWKKQCTGKKQELIKQLKSILEHSPCKSESVATCFKRFLAKIDQKRI